MFGRARRIFSLLAETRRRFGIFAVLHLLADRLAKHILHPDIINILWLNLENLRLPPADPVFSFQSLTAAEVEGFAEDPSNDLRAESAERIRGGHNLCFAALAGGRLASYEWFAPGAIEPSHAFGVALSYPQYMAYWYKGYTHPDFRGKRLLGIVTGLALQQLAAQGVRELVGMVSWTNFPMLRGCYQLGCVLLGRVVVLRLRGRQFILTAPRRAEHLGVRFGAEAQARG